LLLLATNIHTTHTSDPYAQTLDNGTASSRVNRVCTTHVSCVRSSLICSSIDGCVACCSVLEGRQYKRCSCSSGCVACYSMLEGRQYKRCSCIEGCVACCSVLKGRQYKRCSCIEGCVACCSVLEGRQYKRCRRKLKARAVGFKYP
jgi:hypothetical protein